MIIRNVNVHKLLDEFTVTNISWASQSDNVDYLNGQVIGDCIIDFADGTDMVLVQQIIDAHDPTPTIPQPSETERIEQLERENALLKAQKQALSEQVDFHEELIVELATQIYA